MNKNNESTLTIVDLLQLCLARWRWFVASVVICLILAVYYLLTTPYLYKREATVMVLEESLGKNSTMFSAISVSSAKKATSLM